MSSVPREFFVPVELYVPKSVVAPRKQLTRKKTEKRESVRTLTPPTDASAKKVKEKSSWLGLPSRGGGSNEPWRPATCKLVEEDGGCVFKVFIDDSKIYQSVYVHKLNQSDIRPVHQSLVDRKDCLGIYCIAGQTAWSPSNNTEPLYLSFANTDLLNIWQALLRSYATPEVYGRWFSTEASEGGLYRMWRQVKVTCVQGRNLGMPPPAAEELPNADGEAADLYFYGEIFVNEILAGRTTAKKGVGLPDWDESFVFTDLPPFENLEIVIYREKKLAKPVIVGSVLIYLTNFRRGECVEGWFPVVNNISSHTGTRLGEIRLKVRVDEEIILPSKSYLALHGVIQSTNYLVWVADLETKLKIKDVMEHVIALAQSDDVLLSHIVDLASREVDGTHRTHNALFRGNNVFSKAVEHYMHLYGGAFLEASLGNVIRRLCTEKAIERNVEVLVYWCNEFWTSIYDARKQCPVELRRLFRHIRELVESRYAGHEEQNKDKELPWQSVSSFLFLRYLVPTILRPHYFGVWPGLTEEPVRRSLTLIAKVLQTLANLNTTGQKEEFMAPVKEFLSKSSNAMVVYIGAVSSPDSDVEVPAGGRENREHERNRARLLNALSQRINSSPQLHREAIPTVPYFMDVPRHLAIIVSSIVRHSKKCGYLDQIGESDGTPFDKICAVSLGVEEEAFRRVSRLVGGARIQPNTPTRATYSPVSPYLSNAPSSPASTPFSPSSPASPASTSHRERKSSLQGKRRRSHRMLRPSTAPGDSEVRIQQLTTTTTSNVSVPPSPAIMHTISRVFSDSSLSSRRSGQIFPSTDDISYEGEPRSLPTGAGALLMRSDMAQHHPRSTSTDSALLRTTESPSSPAASSHTIVEANTPDGTDDAGRRRKGLLRGILVRR